MGATGSNVGGGGVTRTGMGDTREVWYILVISGEEKRVHRWRMLIKYDCPS